MESGSAAQCHACAHSATHCDTIVICSPLVQMCLVLHLVTLNICTRRSTSVPGVHHLHQRLRRWCATFCDVVSGPCKPAMDHRAPTPAMALNTVVSLLCHQVLSPSWSCGRLPPHAPAANVFRSSSIFSSLQSIQKPHMDMLSALDTHFLSSGRCVKQEGRRANRAIPHAGFTPTNVQQSQPHPKGLHAAHRHLCLQNPDSNLMAFCRAIKFLATALSPAETCLPWAAAEPAAVNAGAPAAAFQQRGGLRRECVFAADIALQCCRAAIGLKLW